MFGLVVGFIILALITLASITILGVIIYSSFKNGYDTFLSSIGLTILIAVAALCFGFMTYNSGKDIFSDGSLITETTILLKKDTQYHSNSFSYYIYIEDSMNKGEEIRLRTSVFDYKKIKERETYELEYYKNTKALQTFKIVK